MAAVEATTLAEAYLRSGGKTTPTADPEDAGHNVSTVCDVAQEARLLVRVDPILKATNPNVQVILLAELENFCREKPDVTQAGIMRMRAALAILESTYIQDGWAYLEDLVRASPRKLYEIEDVLCNIIADVRGRGFSDDSIAAAFSANDCSSVRTLAAALHGRPQSHRCYLAADLSAETTARLRSARLQNLAIATELPAEATGPPPPPGPFVTVEVTAADSRHAASLARSRVEILFGALGVLSHTHVELRSNLVVVEVSGALTSVLTSEVALPKESRRPSRENLQLIIERTWHADAEDTSDPLFDAIRYHRKAVQATDLDSRFMFLWLGLERLVLGSRDHQRVLRATKELLPKTISMSRIRREVGSLAASIRSIHLPAERKTRLFELVGGGERNAGSVDPVRLLERLLGNEAQSRELTALFYDEDPRLTQWYSRLRKALGNGDEASRGPYAADYIEESNRRVEWHILRLYRARNMIAHVGQGPAWMRDLVIHAHHYLTQLVALIVHYRAKRLKDSTVEVIAARCGQYDNYISLLRAGDAKAISPKMLLRPSRLFGQRE